MRGNIKSFEKSFTHSEVVALAERTLKRFGGDKNKAGRYARSMESRYESSKWAQVVEVLATSGRHHATTRKTVRDSHGDAVAVVAVPATGLRRGDIIWLASDSLRIEEAPISDKGRIKIVARSAKQAGGLVRRSYLASQVFDVERAESSPSPSPHQETKKSPAQLQREIDDVLGKSFDRKEAAEHILRPETRFSQLELGTQFRFPGTSISHTKLAGTWYRDGATGGRFETGAGTAVIALSDGLRS